MRQIMLRMTESPGSRLKFYVMGEKPLDISLLGDRSGHLPWASGQGPHVYSYYGPCILLRIHLSCVIILPGRGNYYDPEIYTHLWAFMYQFPPCFWTVKPSKLLKAKLVLSAASTGIGL